MTVSINYPLIWSKIDKGLERKECLGNLLSLGVYHFLWKIIIMPSAAQ